MRKFLTDLRDMCTTLLLSARMLAGRRFWIVPFLPLAWTAFHAVRLLTGMRESRFAPDEAQFGLIGFPLTVLAIGLGVRIIAGEIEQRTLEVTYTVPGGAHRAFLNKIFAAVILLVAGEALLAIVTHLFFTSFPPGALYGALQGAVFYLIVAMSLGALFRSELTGTLAGGGLLFFNLLATGFGEFQTRFSPLFNPTGLDDDPADVLAWTVQNHIGVVLAIVAVTVVTFSRAQRREKLLG